MPRYYSYVTSRRLASYPLKNKHGAAVIRQRRRVVWPAGGRVITLYIQQDPHAHKYGTPESLDAQERTCFHNRTTIQAHSGFNIWGLWGCGPQAAPRPPQISTL